MLSQRDFPSVAPSSSSSSAPASLSSTWSHVYWPTAPTVNGKASPRTALVAR